MGVGIGENTDEQTLSRASANNCCILIPRGELSHVYGGIIPPLKTGRLCLCALFILAAPTFCLLFSPLPRQCSGLAWEWQAVADGLFV